MLDDTGFKEHFEKSVNAARTTTSTNTPQGATQIIAGFQNSPSTPLYSKGTTVQLAVPQPVEVASPHTHTEEYPIRYEITPQSKLHLILLFPDINDRFLLPKELERKASKCLKE